MPTTGNPLLDLAAVLAALGAGAVGVYWVVIKPGRWLWRSNRRFGRFLDDWHGTPARPGVEAKPGAMERFQRIEHRLELVEGEVAYNAGTSTKDAVARIEGGMVQLRQTVDAHIERTQHTPAVHQDIHVADPPHGE